MLVRCLYCSRLFLTARDTDPCGVCGFDGVVVVDYLEV